MYDDSYDGAQVGVLRMMRAIVIVILILGLLSGAGTSGAESEANGPIETDLIGTGSPDTAPANFTSDQNYSYEEIDLYALSAPASARASVTVLASYLTESAKNDREKARAIYRWIAANIGYNVQVFFKGGVAATAVDDVLKSGKSVCFGYSNLFLALAEEAGLQAVSITGYGKGYGYRPGDNFSGPSSHAWNAVMINGSWYLVDCTWGAGYVGGNGEYVEDFDDHYFMTPPDQFIYEHYPDDSYWQLLDRPISLQEFERLPYLESDFFNIGLELAGSINNTVEASGNISISIYAPDDVIMTAGLERAGAGNGADLDRYTFCQRDGRTYFILAEFPEKGGYILKVYAKRKDDGGDLDSVMELGINATSADADGLGYPLAYSKFAEAGAYLYSPMQGRLIAGENCSFKVMVPGAEKVAVVSNGEWSYLASQGNLFEGNVTVAKGETGVFAKMGETEWDGIVGYFEN